MNRRTLFKAAGVLLALGLPKHSKEVTQTIEAVDADAFLRLARKRSTCRTRDCTQPALCSGYCYWHEPDAVYLDAFNADGFQVTRRPPQHINCRCVTAPVVKP